MKSISALIACSDLAGYAKLARSKPEEEIFRLLSGYYEFVGDSIAPAHGRVIKFMGDAALMLFPESSADAGIAALRSLQAEGDRYLAALGVPCRHHIRAHFGNVLAGELGTRGEKRTDILGSAVNTLFLLKNTGFTMTAEAFRKLGPETRALFKKHTPPVTYIPLDQPHKDWEEVLIFHPAKG